MGEEGTHIDCDRFCRWAKQNCPRVFDGIHFWMIKMLLYRGHSPGTVPQVINWLSPLYDPQRGDWSQKLKYEKCVSN